MCVTLLTAAAVSPLSAQPLRTATSVFTAESPGDTLLNLPVRWVLFDSLRVYRNGEFLPEFQQWRIVEPGNRIWVYRPLGPLDTLRVEYSYRPYPLWRSYARRSMRELVRYSEPDAAADSLRMVPAPAVDFAASEGWSRLNKSGSLIRSVQIGTDQDLALESALNLQIQGRVGKDVDVIAALTDQSTPIQPEGTTESLSELEKIFISVRAPHWATTLGDYTLDLAGGQYDGYSRKLTGVMAEANAGGVQVTGSGAASRGQFFSYSFSGQEANQGPYPLPGRNGEVGIVILAGTERVWLNGELLRRGEGNDYTIDYSAGEIRFTSRRIITSDSRLVADYEYTSEDYERFYGAGRVETALVSDRVRVAVTWISETDDRTRPINMGLTSDDRRVLESAGDDPTQAVLFAADSIGASGGDYVRRDTLYADSTYSIFVFSPRDSLNQPTGQWRVLFDDFGVGNGDYEANADSLGLTYFRWVGEWNGRYRPYRRLPLPGRQDLADVRWSVSPLRGLELSGEAAASRKDLNTLSELDDADNDGAAVTGAVRFSREKLSLFGVKPHRVGASARLRHRDRRFVEMSRSSEVEFARDWDAEANRGFEETIREADARISPIREITVYGSYGDLQRPEQSSSQRRTMGLSANVRERWNLNAEHLALRSEHSVTGRRGDWIRQFGNLRGQWGRLAPRFGAERERKRNRDAGGLSGFRFLDYFGGMGLQLPANITWDSEYRRRLDDYLTSNDTYAESARSYIASSEAVWNPVEGGRTLLRYAHREKKYAAQDSADVVTDVGRLESLIVPRNRVYEANVVYEIAKTRSQNQILVAVEVPAGTGSYRREGDQYVPDDQGNYILVPRYTGVYEPATELTLNSLFWLRPDELQAGATADWLRALSAETELSLEERTRRSLTTRLLLLDQAFYRGDSTLWGNLLLRQDVHIRRLSQKLGARLRYRFHQSLQNQYLNGGQSRTLREGSVRVRARYWSFWRGETEAQISRERLRYQSGTAPDRDMDRVQVSQDNTLALSRRWEAGVNVKVVEANDDRMATQASLRELEPHAALRLTNRGRFDASVTWIHASSNKRVIPYELGRGANRGENYRWSLRGTYQFGQTLSGSLSYTSRQDAREKTYHTGRLEVRASF